MAKKKRAVTKVDPHDAKCFLLQRRLGVEHPHMHDDLARLIVDAALEFDSHPAVEFMAAAVASGYHGVGKGKEGSIITALFPEPFHVEIELAVEHGLQPPARDITLGVPVNGVAYFHVVRRHTFGDGSGRAADAKKPAYHLLPGADLGKGSVPAWIEIDPERFRMG